MGGGVGGLERNIVAGHSASELTVLNLEQPPQWTSGRLEQASDVVDEVITQISVLRGRLGAFERNTLQPNINQLQITSENLTSSQAVIRDTDFAAETSELTRAQILVQAGNSI